MVENEKNLKMFECFGHDFYNIAWTKINSDYIFLLPKVWRIFPYMNDYFSLL